MQILDLSQPFALVPVSSYQLSQLIAMRCGKWVHGANCATQDADGEILFWSLDTKWVRHAMMRCDPTIGISVELGLNGVIDSVKLGFVASDWSTALVSRDQYERERAKQNP